VLLIIATTIPSGDAGTRSKIAVDWIRAIPAKENARDEIANPIASHCDSVD